MKAVLFDLDGVIINSPKAHYAAWKKAFKEFAVDIKPDDLFLIEGMTKDEIAKRLCKQSDLPVLEAAKVIQKKDQHFEKSKISLYPGMLELILLLRKKGAKLAIVTASSHASIGGVLTDAFLKKFDAVVFGSKQGKDNPYAQAAKQIGVPAEHCVVVENAPIGVQAAKAAGMYCIAITTTLKENQLSQADKAVKDVAALAELLKVLIA
ncbi:MAG: HAD family phosphatase [archaeon]